MFGSGLAAFALGALLVGCSAQQDDRTPSTSPPVPGSS
jgi:hypothetical protein